MRRALALLGVTALLLTGCEAAPVYGPSPTPSTPPIFATEEEAVAAAARLLDAYMAALTEFGQTGGTKPDLLSSLTTERMLADELDFWTENPTVESILGVYRYSNFELQLLDQREPGVAYVQAYLCLAFEGTRVTASGEEVVAATPHPVEVLFETVDGELRIDDFRPWTGRDFCEQ